MTRTTIVMAAGLALVAVLSAAPVQAQALRTFVSTTGLDTNPCSITEPCRHFQAAVTATAVGGEVDALDAGSYSPITISHAITINGQGWSYLAPNTGGNGITINAVSGNVTIIGVSINGVGVTGGTNGIVFSSGDSLTVTDCLLQNFTQVSGNTGNGILIQPTSDATSFAITNTISLNNLVGINYFPTNGATATATGVIDQVVASNNDYGLQFFTGLGAGGGATEIAISNSVISNNTGVGVFVENGSNPLTVSFDNSSANGNHDGIFAGATTNVKLGRSVITANSQYGVWNTTSNTFYSYSDNRINDNGTGSADDVFNTALNYSYALK